MGLTVGYFARVDTLPAALHILNETRAELETAEKALARLNVNLSASIRIGLEWGAIAEMRSERDLVRNHVDKLQSRISRMLAAKDQSLAKTS